MMMKWKMIMKVMMEKTTEKLLVKKYAVLIFIFVQIFGDPLAKVRDLNVACFFFNL
jgi:hypothetical protein